MNGSLFLIPTYLDDSNDSSFLSPMVLEVVQNCKYFLVENVRTSRRFISSLNLDIDISNLNFGLLDKNTPDSNLKAMIAPIQTGQDIGVMSEAGLPGLADPGNLAVRYCHRNNIKVVPLPGSSSIQTALILSGFNGQQFVFHGYVPIQKPERIIFLKRVEAQAQKTGYTQLFMETPFRNQSLFDDLVSNCHGETLLSIASGLFGPHELVQTMSISEWQKNKINIHKIPTVFSIGGFK